MNTIRIQCDDFDIAGEIDALRRGCSDIGAVVTFTGLVRGDDGVSAMTLEHYPDMTEREIARHVEDARILWSLQGVTIIHRIGKLKPGENIVLVATTSEHRQAAFEAAEFLMDYLKTRAPFWKLEERRGNAEWIEARGSDEDAAIRWRED